MVTKFTIDSIPEYYDEGWLPWPWPEDEVPERLPIEMMQSSPIRQILEILNYYLGTDSVFVDTNIPIRFNPNNRRVFIAPDIIVAFDVDVRAIGERERYDIWEVGKPPDFVLEVASRSTYRNDLYEKPDIYAYLGVREYWMFDPTGGDMYGQTLAGYRLVDGEYEPIEIAPNQHEFNSGRSEALGMRLCSIERSKQDEVSAVRPHFFFMPFDVNHSRVFLQDEETGTYLMHPQGFPAEYERAEQSRQQAETRADRAETRADRAETRAERAERELEAARAEIARLRDRSRHTEQD